MTAPGGYQQPERVNPIQLLSVLAGIQQSRRQQDLAERQFEEGKVEFGRQMGLTEKSAEYKKFADAMDLYAHSSMESRNALSGLGQTLFPGNPQMQDLLQKYGQNAPESLQAIQQVAATKGYRGALQPAQDQMNSEAAAQATTGMNQGAMQGSGLQAIIAQQGQQQVTPQMGQDAAQFTANRQNPLEALIGHAIAGNPEQARSRVAMEAGTGMSAVQRANVDIGRGGVEAEFAKLRAENRYQEMEIATKLLTAKQAGAMTPEVLMSAYGRLHELQQDITNPKASESARNQSMAAYNSLAAIMGQLGLQYPDNKASTTAGVGQRMREGITGTVAPPSNMSKPPVDLNQQSNPIMSTPWMPQPGNPMNPFLRRP